MNKLKLDLITLHAVQNYGSVLQAVATQKLFEEHGCDVKVINYIRENVRPENLLDTWSKGNIIKKIIMYPTVKRWNNVFSKFCEKNLNLTDKVYTYEKDFEDYPLDADVYCTGSDQVWNSKWNRGIIKPLYLNFVPESKKKIAFSSSFGQSELSSDEIKKTKDFIMQYDYISVREESAKDIIEKQYGYKNAYHILDPTLAVTEEFWRKFSCKRLIKEDYILIYNLNRSKAFDKYAKMLSKKTRLKLVRLCTRYDQFYRVGKSVLVPEVEQFISLIDNAKYVLTDSFHATAFSINMQTEPICVFPPEFSGRLESFLTLINSMQRKVEDYNDFDVVNRYVDFKNVNEILASERKKVHDFIDISLK